MKFTFGITTMYQDLYRLDAVIQSIKALNIPEHEIIVAGHENFADNEDASFLYFQGDNKLVNARKNAIVEKAKYNNVVLLHDYYVFDPAWYNNFVAFGEDWDVCSNAQLLINDKRHFTDWVTWEHPVHGKYYSMDYNDWSDTKYMYQSGGFLLLKKEFGLKIPFNNEMGWGTAEDVEWSLRMRDVAVWKCNGNSIVKHNKVHRDVK